MPKTQPQRPRDQLRRARNELYRQHILDAAEQVFAERGFAAARLQEISEGAGLSMGTIYALFPSKEDIYLALIEERGGRILQLVRDLVAGGEQPRALLAALIATYVDFFVAHPNFLRMHLRAGTAWILSPVPESDQRVQLWKEIHTLQAEIFRRGVEAGVFIDEDAAFLAKMFSAMDQVLLADWVEGGMRASRDELIHRLQRLVERALAPMPVA
jgi:AcrR family transcriptional regulator